MSRAIGAWLVLDCSGQYEDYFEWPIAVFQSHERAEHCAMVHDERGKDKMYFDWHEPHWSIVRHVKVILDD